MNQKNPTARSIPQRMARRLLFLLATVYFILDELFRSALKPVVAWLSTLPAVARFERWVAGFGPYQTLAFMLVPLAVLEPLKLLALYRIGLGHWLGGALMILFAYGFGIVVTERLFAISRDKLLSIAWFSYLYFKIANLRQKVFDWIAETWAWRMARFFVRRAKRAARLFYAAVRSHLANERTGFVQRQIALARAFIKRSGRIDK